MAEVLAVVVLLALAAVAGQTAQDLSTKIDRHALADLARSDPLEVCVNGAATFTARQFNGPLAIVPVFNGLNPDTPEDYDLRVMHAQLKWGELANWQCAWPLDEGSKLANCKEQESLSLSEGHDTSLNDEQRTLLDEATTTAMYRCGLIAGITWGDGFIQALRDNTLGALPQWQPDGETKVNASFGGRKYYQLTALHRITTKQVQLHLFTCGQMQ